MGAQIMQVKTLIDSLLSDNDTSRILSTPLSDELAAAVVEKLKQEADRHWRINANRSLNFADLIIEIGQGRKDTSQVALGLMARGDALKLLDRMDEAWEMLEQAGRLYE